MSNRFLSFDKIWDKEEKNEKNPKNIIPKVIVIQLDIKLS